MLPSISEILNYRHDFFFNLHKKAVAQNTFLKTGNRNVLMLAKRKKNQNDVTNMFLDYIIKWPFSHRDVESNTLVIPYFTKPKGNP